MTILVAEDEALMLKTIQIKLSKEGFTVVPCADGAIALEKIAEHKPQVVLTDLNLPHANGETIITAAKAANPDVKILVLTGMEATVAKEKVINLGATDVLIKPFSLVELLKRVTAMGATAEQ
jgi:DNA-binding response OmpR family regulator